MTLATTVRQDTRRITLETLLYLPAVAVIVLPALWNGFPILFPDTGGYLARPLEGTLELGRSALYGLFLAVVRYVQFWPVVIAQAGIVVWLITLLWRSHGARAVAGLTLASAATLSVATAMPWTASTLLPDILLPCAVLALYLLIFHTTVLRRAEIIALSLLIAVAIASHMGTLAVALGLLVACAVLHFVGIAKLRLLIAAAAVASGVVLAPLSNLAITGHFTFTPGGESFLFGRLVHDGIIKRYVADTCPDDAVTLCRFADRLPITADEWLWAPGNPMGELGGWRGYADEERRIISETLRRYPLQHMTAALTSTVRQLMRFKTEVSLNLDWMAPVIEAMPTLAPQAMPAIRAARQQAKPFVELIDTLNLVHEPIGALSVFGLLAIVLIARRGALPPDAFSLAAFVLSALLLNAAICGIFSNPVDRYQSRLIWLAPLALAVILWQRWSATTRHQHA